MARPVPKHGTPGRYQGPRRHNRWQPCRCEPCRAAYRRQSKQQELRRTRGIPSYADATAVAAHVQRLLDADWTASAIADAAKIDKRSVWNLRNGTHRGVQHAVAGRVLALRPDARPASHIDATGTTRRLQALSTIGWSLTWCASEAKVSLRYLNLLIAGHQTVVGVAIAERIATLYRAHCGRPGPSRDARAAATRNGWHGPLTWDEIDNPNEQPDLGDGDEPATPRYRALAEDGLWLERTQGYTRQHAAERLGVTRDNLQAAIDRARRAEAKQGDMEVAA